MRRFGYFKPIYLQRTINRPIERIYIHTVAVRGVSALSSHDNYHITTKGWDGFGYHEYIKKNGTVEPGRNPNVAGAGVFGDNTHTYHIVLEGHGDFEKWTPEQWKAVQTRCVSVMLRARTKSGERLLDVFKKNPMRLMGHREINFLVRALGWTTKYKTLKSCPGLLVDMSEVRRRVLEAIPNDA